MSSKSKRFRRFFFLLLLVWKVEITLPQRAPVSSTSASVTESTPAIQTKYHKDHRTIQWCVNGIEEPEFQMYPWSEFSSILQRRFSKYNLQNVRFKYSIDLRPVKMKVASRAEIGKGQVLLQRGHLVFRAQLRREFRWNVKTSFNESLIEGLLVQVNYAKYGIGLPAPAQFLHPKDFNCHDCTRPIAIPIACRKRTYFHSVHPTLMAYHYKMPVPNEEQKRRRDHCINKLIPNQCIISGFKDLDENLKLIGKPVEPNSQEIRKMMDWRTDPIAGDILKDHVNRPHPEVVKTCTSNEDCNDIFESWFSTACCPVNTESYCNRSPPPSNDTGASGGAGGAAGAGAPTAGPTPDPTTTEAPKEISQYCPNRPFQAEPGTTGHDAANYDATATFFTNPREQSLNYPVFECRPFYTTVCRPPHYTAEPGNVPWETRDDLQKDFSLSERPQLQTPVDPFDPNSQCCQGVAPGEPCPTPLPNSPPKPTQSCKAEDPSASPPILKTECIPRVVLPFNQALGVEVPPPNVDNCTSNSIKDGYYPPSSEVHGNLVWYFPPCQRQMLVRFQLLVVHSFSRGIYSIVESQDYYDLKPADEPTYNEYLPSPLFSGFPHECDAFSSADFLYATSALRLLFDYSRSYDQCIQSLGDDVNEQMCHADGGVPPFEYHRERWERRRSGKPPMPYCDPLKYPAIDPKYRSCAEVCPGVPSTTEEPATTVGINFIKRSLHGAINLITNFCIMPVCIFIARFYKETYNLSSFKGQRTWYWMHMIGAGGSTVLQYLGFFSRQRIEYGEPHVIYGNIYIICLAVAYISAWMRHKKRFVSAILEIIHSGFGYSCLALAIICLDNSENRKVPTSWQVKIAVYINLIFLAVCYVIMTVHICWLDHKFGMKPKRWHFPIVESRFEDLPVPGRRCRQFFLVVIVIVNIVAAVFFLILPFPEIEEEE